MNNNKNLIKFLKSLNLEYKNIKHYEIATTHSSFANENRVESNERYEFLGDSILQYIISDYIFKNSHKNEGDLTKLRSKIVRKEALYLFSCNIGLDKLLKLGHGEIIKGATPSIISDLFEAFLCAIYLDLGIEKVKEFLYEKVIPNIDLTKNIKDYKTQLQELVQSDKRTIRYHLLSEEGPSHAKVFTINVYLDNNILLGTGIGSSKKEAEQNAAKEAIKKGCYDVKKTI